MNRMTWLLGDASFADLILEIGPSYSPIAPKAGGWRTHVVDHASQEDLRAKYAALNTDTTPIEPVDSVWAGGPLDAAVPADLAGRFARLIASHVIEHIPDLIAFLESAARLLAPGGVVALAVPDQRHCFDFFKPFSTTADVLEAHQQKRSRHGDRTVWSQAAYSVTRRGVGVWGDEAVPDLQFAGTFEEAVETWRAYADSPDAPYRDCHAWQFTPARFQLVMLELGQMGAIDWHVAELEGFGAEFLCALRRGARRLDAATLQRQRMDWLYRGLAETRAQIDRALPGGGVAGAVGAAPPWGALPMLRGAR
jgi:SAM-dependent methyltransferase